MVATRLTPNNAVSWSCTVSLLDYANEVSFDWYSIDQAVRKLERLKYVDYVEDRHQLWLRLELETSSATVADRRLRKVMEKVERIITLYQRFI